VCARTTRGTSRRKNPSRFSGSREKLSTTIDIPDDADDRGIVDDVKTSGGIIVHCDCRDKTSAARRVRQHTRAQKR
jgi:hypothetical protein